MRLSRFRKFFRRKPKKVKDKINISKLEKIISKKSPPIKIGKYKSISKPKRREIVRIARSQVGVKEVGGNNKGSKIREYQAASWLDPAPWPWCAAFVCWVMLKAGHLPYSRPRTAGAFDLARWAKKNGLRVHGRGEFIEAGDIIIFDFSHVGIAVEDSDSTIVVTVEGNTGASGSRDGDGVWEKQRSRALIRHVIKV